MKSKIYKVKFELPLTRDEDLVMILAAMKVSGMQFSRAVKQVTKARSESKKKKKVVPKSH